jgi:selenocysteine lyase/cysteine desulfurase/rhodanese-related sulfurtransferase
LQTSASQPVRILDVREPDELDSGTIPGATTIPRGLVERHIAEYFTDREAPLYVLCEGGGRSVLVADALLNMGYANVCSVRGGMDAWVAQKLPIDLSPSALRGALSDDGPLSWDEVRAQFPIAGRRVPVLGLGEQSLCYLDHAASTHTPACVLDRYSTFMSGEYANIHRGTHHLSRMATELFDQCYDLVARFIGGELERSCVVFQTNTTQAIDLASHSVASIPGKVLVTELEHHSNDLPHRKRGPVLRARATPDGALDMDHLEQLLSHDDVKLVAMTGASNVTGWMPDIHAVARLAHAHGAYVLLDCAQLLAHQQIDVRDPDDPEHIDFVAAAGHKAYAPFGASFLYAPRAVLDAAPPYLPGGGTATRVTKMTAEFVGSPDRHQGGTPNIGGVIALAEALRFLDRVGMDRVREHELGLTRTALDGLSQLEGVTVYGPASADARLGVISFNVEGVSDLLTAAVLSEERALACRNGRFCAHVYVDRLLKSQGGANPEAGSEPGAVRASFGLYNRPQDAERLVDAVRMVRDRGWAGEYRVREDTIAADYATRCNDRWMERGDQSAE